jgi:hypothetical protein
VFLSSSERTRYPHYNGGITKSSNNDLDGDRERYLQLNSDSSFFAGLKELEMDNRIRPFLQRYTDFDFVIDYDKWLIRFSRKVNGTTVDNIKVSRGEENLFIWCFFLAIVQLALDGADAYKWVKYIYIDDPISSLDENNAIAVGHDLAQLLASNPLGHCRSIAWCDGRGRFPRLHAVVPVPALPVRQLRGRRTNPRRPKQIRHHPRSARLYQTQIPRRQFAGHL